MEAKGWRPKNIGERLRERLRIMEEEKKEREMLEEIRKNKQKEEEKEKLLVGEKKGDKDWEEEEEREKGYYCMACGMWTTWHKGGSCGSHLKPLYKICPIKGYQIETEHYSEERDPGLDQEKVLVYPYVEVDWRWPWADWKEILYNAWKKSGKMDWINTAKIQYYEQGEGTIKREILGYQGNMMIENWEEYEEKVNESLELRERWYNTKQETKKRMKMEKALGLKDREVLTGKVREFEVSWEEFEEDVNINTLTPPEDEEEKEKEKEKERKKEREKREEGQVKVDKAMERDMKNISLRMKKMKKKEKEPCYWYWNDKVEEGRRCPGQHCDGGCGVWRKLKQTDL